MTATRFPGFPDRLSYLPTPVQLFGTLLRDVDSLAELKLALHCWRLLYQQRGRVRFLQRSHLRSDRALLQAVGSSGSETPETALETALEAVCSRGVLLSVDVLQGEQADRCYVLNTPANRELVERLRAGETSLSPSLTVLPMAPLVGLPRPGIYELYEQNIGLLTPLVTEELREAERQYPPEWIEDAFREAVAYNRRNWRYIRRILENWATEGRGQRGENRRHPQPVDDPRRFIAGRYGRHLKR